MDVPVYNMKGEQVGAMSIDEQALGGTVNPQLIKQAYVRYHANRRQGSARTKSRSDVEGSKRKIYRQKGTGRARHGDRYSNIFRGGGMAFAKKRGREDYRLEMPKKMRRKANRNALLSKLLDDEVRVIDDLSFERPRTRDFVEMLAALKVDRRALVALGVEGEGARNALLSARNCEHTSICRADQLNCFEMLNHRYLVIAREDLEAWLAGASSVTDKRVRREPAGAGEAA